MVVSRRDQRYLSRRVSSCTGLSTSRFAICLRMSTVLLMTHLRRHATDAPRYAARGAVLGTVTTWTEGGMLTTVRPVATRRPPRRFVRSSLRRLLEAGLDERDTHVRTALEQLHTALLERILIAAVASIAAQVAAWVALVAPAVALAPPRDAAAQLVRAARAPGRCYA